MSSNKLWIFEKPSLAKSVIEQLPKPHIKKNGYFETGDGIVTWCFGHLLEQVPPKDYDEKYGKWDIDLLPILPEKWKLKATESKKAQLNVIKSLLKQCDVVINGGDEGREGQLLIDEILIEYKNKKPVLRYLSAANDPASVKKALNNLQDNKNFINHYNSALGRSRADWLIGMNITMAMTSQLQKQQSKKTLLSIGRVQTPTLALIVKRDLEILHFKPQTYYALSAQFISDNIPFWTRWLPEGKTLEQLEKGDKKEASGEFDDEEDDDIQDNSKPWLKDSKIIDKDKAIEIERKIKNAGKGEVINYIKRPAKESQPLPNDLGELQKIMNNKYNYNVSDTLKACQELYEKGYTTYPRTDCRYLPEVQISDAQSIFKSLKSAGIFENLIDNVDTKIKAPCWNDGKIGEHHAIIPTQTTPDINSLTQIQRRVYEDIVKKYIAIFYPECIVDKTKVEILIADERFSASGRVIQSAGWRVVFGAEENDSEKVATLPSLEKGLILPLKDLKNEEKKTTPPPHYTQASLVSVMQNIHRVLDNPEERKRLKGEGLGRSATRDSIINTLYDRNYVSQSGRFVISTDLGKVVIKSAPVALTSPSLTAQWEKALDMISTGKFTLEQFENKQREFIRMLVENIKKSNFPNFPDQFSTSSNSKSSGSYNKTSTKKASGKKCPQCKKGNLVSKKISKGDNAGKSFKGCSNYPECKYTEWPKK